MDKQENIYALVKVLEERSKNILAKVDEIAELQKIANGRTGRLEQWRSKTNGYWKAITVVSAVFAFAIGVILKIVL